MNLIARRPGTGALLITSAILSVLGFAVLGPAFGWPGVLEESGTTALDKYLHAETAIRSGFYLMTLASLAMIPAAFGLQAATSTDRTAARVITAFGVLGAFAQMLGWLRWVVAVPVQAHAWAAASADPMARRAIATSYDTLNAYAGATLGEHLGFLLQGIWATGVFVLALRVTGIPRWVTWPGIVLSGFWTIALTVGSATSTHALKTAGNSAYTGWYVWLIVLGVVIARRRVGPTVASNS